MSTEEDRIEIADEISGVQVGVGYESTTIGITAALEAADLLIAAGFRRTPTPAPDVQALIADAREWPRDGINEGRLINTLADALEAVAHSDYHEGLEEGIKVGRAEASTPQDTEWEYGAGYEADNGIEMRWFSIGSGAFTIREAAEHEVERFADPQIRLVRRTRPGPWEPVPTEGVSE